MLLCVSLMFFLLPDVVAAESIVDQTSNTLALSRTENCLSSQNNRGIANKRAVVIPKTENCNTFLFKWKIVAEQHKVTDIGVTKEFKGWYFSFTLLMM